VVLYVVSNAFVKALLFLTAGRLRAVYGTNEVAAAQRRHPRAAVLGHAVRGGHLRAAGLPAVRQLHGRDADPVGHRAGRQPDRLHADVHDADDHLRGHRPRSIFPMLWGPSERTGPPVVEPWVTALPKLGFVTALVLLGVYTPAPISAAAGAGGAIDRGPVMMPSRSCWLILSTDRPAAARWPPGPTRVPRRWPTGRPPGHAVRAPRRRGQRCVVTAVLQRRRRLHVLRGTAPAGAAYPIADRRFHPAAQMFERELWEQTGLQPTATPGSSRCATRAQRQQHMDEHPFFKVRGQDVHEVGVGPIHASVIEPGTSASCAMASRCTTSRSSSATSTAASRRCCCAAAAALTRAGRDRAGRQQHRLCVGLLRALEALAGVPLATRAWCAAWRWNWNGWRCTWRR
jgi:hypothetical protein